MSEKTVPVSLKENSLKDDVHHALDLCSLLLQLEEQQEGYTEATPSIKGKVLSVSSCSFSVYLCDLPLYFLQLLRALLPHRLRFLHLIQLLTVFNASAQAESHAHQRAQQLHR